MTNKQIYTVVVIGSGPAAYSALLYLQHLSPLHIEGSIVGSNGPGGQLTTTTDVDNYPGFPNGIQGPVLMEQMKGQVDVCVVSENVVCVEVLSNFNMGKEAMCDVKRAKVDCREEIGINCYEELHVGEHNETITDKSNKESFEVESNKDSHKKIHKIESNKEICEKNDMCDSSNTNCDAKTDSNLKVEYEKNRNDKIQIKSFNQKQNNLLGDNLVSQNEQNEKSADKPNEVNFNNKINAIENIEATNKSLVKEANEHFDSFSIFKITTEDDNIFYTKCVLVCTGAQAKRLYVPGTNDNEFWQKGVSSCAVCDGWIYKDKKVIVIGGGDSAMEEASYLSKIASEVILIHRSENFRARKDMLKKIKNNNKVKIMINYELECVRGEKKMNCAYFRNVINKELVKIDAEALFFGIGHVPNTSFLNESFIKDEHGYLITDKECKTSIKGVFACGDVQDKRYRQAITAAGSGCTAAFSAISYLKSINQTK